MILSACVVLQDKIDALHHHVRITEMVQNGKTGTNSFGFRARWQLEHKMMEGIDVSDQIMEDFVNRKAPLVQVLRLLCLQVRVRYASALWFTLCACLVSVSLQ